MITYPVGTEISIVPEAHDACYKAMSFHVSEEDIEEMEENHYIVTEYLHFDYLVIDPGITPTHLISAGTTENLIVRYYKPSLSQEAHFSIAQRDIEGRIK